MSRTPPLLLIALLAAPVNAQSSSAIDQAIADQRTGLRAQLRLDCPRPEDDEEIVVCGSREEQDRRYRLPPVEGAPQGAADRAGGEQRAALAIDSSTCTTVGRDQQCNGGLDMIGIGFTIARAIAQAIVEDE